VKTKKIGGLEPVEKIIPELKAELPSSNGALRSSSEISSPQENECGICKGTGLVHPRKEDGKPDYTRVVPCRCAKVYLDRWRSQHIRSWCELPPAAEHMTFENFKRSPALDEAYQAALAVADGDGEWLILMGDVDRGKTHLAVAICKRWLASGKLARYAYVPLLLDELRRGFRGEGDNSYDVRFDQFLNVPLLVLDDLGVESPTAWVQERLDTIIDYRLMHELPLVITTNCAFPGSHYKSPARELPLRIASRLKRKGRIVFIDSPAYSRRRNYEKA
jgi:DNA replication protein DnaC